MSALFTTEGELVVPTELARGPWDPRALHGGPVGALLARAVEACPTDGPMEVARVTVELLRPVPVEALAVQATVARPGRKVQLVEATLRHAATGTEVARARALRIRSAPVELPDDEMVALEPPPLPGPASSRLERTTLSEDYAAFHNAGSEHRFAEGSWMEPGPVVVWIRLLAPVVAGEEPSPLQRTLAAADFGNGVSRVLSWDTHLFINPDLTVHLVRPSEGEWIGLDAHTSLGPSGLGMAESALFDTRGRIGRSVQSLLVDGRAPSG